LRSRDTLVRVQSDFRQERESETTLKKLPDYIRDCSAVVCVIGKRSGALSPPAAEVPFNHMLSPGIARASYRHGNFSSRAISSGGCRSTSPRRTTRPENDSARCGYPSTKSTSA
jgi:hypothetical protein